MSRRFINYKFAPSEDNDDADDDKFDNLDSNKKNSIHSVPIYTSILFLLILIGLLALAVFIDRRLPAQLTIDNEKNNVDQFIGERSYNNLIKLTDFGPRVTGSEANQKSAEFLLNELEIIKKSANSIFQIETEIQTVSGGYFLDFKPYGVTNIYRNVLNVVAKLSSIESTSNSSLLLNSHYDSVPTSPGATDDGISVTTMLEILRVLSQSTTPLQHSIVFLFNGAEENPLQAAHGFITQHRWAKQVRAFVNLEGVGGGGKEMLFQAGPGHPWLMKYYAMSAKHPRAQTVGEELFQSGMIPSDTDFRLFRDFGHIPGLDMAFMKRGHVYHTKYDTVENIDSGSYQHIGDNILPLARALANADELKHTDDFSDGHLVFYDFFGLFLICYSATIGTILNLLIVILGIFTIWAYIHTIGKDNKYVYKQLALSVGVQLLSWIVSLLYSCLIALFLDAVHSPMTWYSRPWLVVGLFSFPTIVIYCTCILFLHHRNQHENILGLNIYTHIHLLSTILIWCIILCIITICGIRAAYLIMFTIIFPILAMILITYTKLRQSVHTWIYVYLAFVFIPVLFNMYESITLVEFFIPITGRIGANEIVDIQIGLMTSLSTIFSLSTIIPFTPLVRLMKWMLSGLFAFSVLTLICVWLSPLGFPYSASSGQYMPERYQLYHTERVFHGVNGKVIYEDSGIFLLNQDRNSPHIVTDYIDELKVNAQDINKFCDTQLYCGLPFSSSRMMTMINGVWIPSTKPVFTQQSDLKLANEKLIKINVRRLTFTAIGPDNLGLFISAKPNVTLINWSLLEQIPRTGPLWNGRSTYYVTYGRGKSSGNDVWEFYLDLEIPDYMKSTSQPILDIVLTAHYKHHDKYMTPAYRTFVNKFPEWTQIAPWISSYKSWQY